METDKEQEKRTRTDLKKAADSGIDLAVERTELALERTQLAWVRTLLSMIGVGFVIDEGFKKLHEARIASGEAWLKNARVAGLVITSLSTLLMIIITILYFSRAKKLSQMRGNEKTLLAPGFMISALTVAIGIFLICLITLF